ncbi:MAG TPA: nitrile hydratase accessory protein [Candidatus Limnocylindria bacterium]|nr:nitrile hydratase accessory protein [Candidatus Limnocylindria bacterium]
MSAPDLAALPAIPRDGDGPVFRAPWEAQAFGMAVALHERGHFAWTEWAARLSDEIAAAQARGEHDDGGRYYHYWLAALEKLVADRKLVLAEELHERRDEWDRAARSTPHGQPIELPPRPRLTNNPG